MSFSFAKGIASRKVCIGVLPKQGNLTRGIYDSMKTAVETVFIGKDRQYNRRFLRIPTGPRCARPEDRLRSKS
jgi:hypothetical protein